MHWFFVALYSVSGILFFGFVGWVTTRVMHLDTANYWMGKVIIWDLYVIGALMAYAAFVGSWHMWEKLTGRMEPTTPQEPPTEG